MATEAEVLKIMVMLAAAFPRFAMGQDTPKIYARLLSDIPFEELEAAAVKVATTNVFFPSVGELREATADLRRLIDGVPTSYEAWQEVIRAMHDVGSYGQPVFSHPLIDRTVAVMGWRNLCLSENQVADRAHFTQAFEQLSARSIHEAMLVPEVRGYIEAQGQKRLAPAEQIRMLADKLEITRTARSAGK